MKQLMSLVLLYACTALAQFSDDPFAEDAGRMKAAESTWRNAHDQRMAAVDHDMCRPGFRDSMTELKALAHDAFDARRKYYQQWHRMIGGRVSDTERLVRAVPAELARLDGQKTNVQRELDNAKKRREALGTRGLPYALEAVTKLIETLNAEILALGERREQLKRSAEAEQVLSNRDMQQLQLLNGRLADAAQAQLRVWDNLYETFIDRGRVRCP